MKSGFNGTEQIIDVPANNAGFVSILATGPVRYVRIIESTINAEGAANVPQGLNYEIPNDTTAAGFTTQFQNPAGVTLELGDPMAVQSNWGSCIGQAAQTYGQGMPPTAATILVKLQSSTATPTSVQVAQYY